MDPSIKHTPLSSGAYCRQAPLTVLTHMPFYTDQYPEKQFDKQSVIIDYLFSVKKYQHPEMLVFFTVSCWNRIYDYVVYRISAHVFHLGFLTLKMTWFAYWIRSCRMASVSSATAIMVSEITPPKGWATSPELRRAM